MKILQRYITTTLLWTTLLAMSVLVALFSFFALIDQLEDVGRGNYQVLQAVMYVVLTMPRLAYDLFPIAGVVGGMAALGVLARNSELAVIRTSGVSIRRLGWAMAKAGVVLAVTAVIIGELVAPFGVEKAQNMRSVALTQEITMKTKYGFWARDGNSYVNIRRILPGNRIQDIYIYEFDDKDQLRSSTYAWRASYQDNKWLLDRISQTSINGNVVTQRHMRHAAWESLLDPEMLNLVVVQPEYLTVWGLFRYIAFLRQNRQNSLRYSQALWIKLIRPFSIIAMVVLAVPLVQGHSRSTALGQRVFIGTIIGVGFHILNEASGHLGVVYQLPPPLSAGAPTLLLIGVLLWLLNRDLMRKRPSSESDDQSPDAETAR